MSTPRWLLAALLVPLWPQPADAADRVQECIGEHVEAQLLRKQGRLLAARDRLVACAEPTCPELVREECSALARELEVAQPSVILSALDADGQPTSEPLVSIDGLTDLVPLDGHPILLDPGAHQLRFQHPEGWIREVEFVLEESEHERRIVADFRASSGSDGGPGERRWPNHVMLASAGVATLALGSFTYFALAGRSVESDLDRCKPNCENQDDVDRMRSRYLIADVSLGVALVSLGVGAYAWTQRSSVSPADRPPSVGRTRVSLQPIATARSVGLWATGEF
jgi:hypothetical protein